MENSIEKKKKIKPFSVRCTGFWTKGTCATMTMQHFLANNRSFQLPKSNYLLPIGSVQTRRILRRRVFAGITGGFRLWSEKKEQHHSFALISLWPALSSSTNTLQFRKKSLPKPYFIHQPALPSEFPRMYISCTSIGSTELSTELDLAAECRKGRVPLATTEAKKQTEPGLSLLFFIFSCATRLNSPVTQRYDRRRFIMRLLF